VKEMMAFIEVDRIDKASIVGTSEKQNELVRIEVINEVKLFKIFLSKCCGLDPV
jgi:hypothetical protein